MAGGSVAERRRPKRMPLWLAVVLNITYGRSFRLCMHATDDPLGWVSCEVGDSFGRALWFHRTYRKLGYR